MQPTRANFSLLQRVLDNTPEGIQLSLFFPFSHLNFQANGIGNSTVSSMADIPVIIHSAPPACNLGDIDMPFTIGKDGDRLRKLSRSQDDAYGHMFGENLIQHLWPVKDADGDADTRNIKVFTDVRSAQKWMGNVQSREAQVGMRVGIVANDKYVKILWRPELVKSIARELREIIKAQSSWRPSMMPIGLGHVNRKGELYAPKWRWDSGLFRQEGRRSNAAGYIDIPTDQIPYGPQRLVAPYWNVMLQAGFAYYKSLSEDLGMPKASSSITKGGFDRSVFAMIQLWLASRGTISTTVSPPNTPIDENQAIQEFDMNIARQFGSGYAQMDLHPNRYPDEDKYLRYIATLIVSEAVFSSCLGKVSTYLVEGDLVSDSGARSERVVEQLLNNFREQINFGGAMSNTLPFSLIPTSLSVGEKQFRIPTCFDPIVTRTDVTQSNVYSGPASPRTLDDIIEIKVIGDKPVTMVEKRRFMASPVIQNDSVIEQIWWDDRLYHCAWINRPTTLITGLTDMSHMFAQMADTEKINGPYFYQPWEGSPLTQKNNKIDMVTSHTFVREFSDAELTKWRTNLYDDPSKLKFVDSRGPIFQTLPGNTVMVGPNTLVNNPDSVEVVKDSAGDSLTTVKIDNNPASESQLGLTDGEADPDKVEETDEA